MKALLRLALICLVAFAAFAHQASSQEKPAAKEQSSGRILVSVVDAGDKPLRIGWNRLLAEAGEECHAYDKTAVIVFCAPFTSVLVNGKPVEAFFGPARGPTAFRLEVSAGKASVEFPKELVISGSRYLVEQAKQAVDVPKAGMAALTMRLIRVEHVRMVAFGDGLRDLPGQLVLVSTDGSERTPVAHGRRLIRTGGYWIRFEPDKKARECQLSFPAGMTPVSPVLLCHDDKGKVESRCLCKPGEILEVRRAKGKYELDRKSQALTGEALGISIRINDADRAIGDPVLVFPEDKVLRIRVGVLPAIK